MLFVDLCALYRARAVASTLTPLDAADSRFETGGELVWSLIAATRAAAIAAARWAGRGDPIAADDAATTALRAALSRAPGTGTIVTGEGAKDGAPMLADGERVGAGGGPEFDIAVDPLECTDLCARGLAGAMSVIAVAPRGSLWEPGPAFYMDKLVVPAGVGPAASIGDPPEAIVEAVGDALGGDPTDVRVVVLDKPRHRDLIARLRRTGASVATPPAGDVAGALEVLLPEGDADLLLGVGGTPEGVMTACAVRALGGRMQGLLAPQREDERRAIEDAGAQLEYVLELDELVGADAAFVATGITGGLLEAPCREGTRLVTESIVIARDTVHHVRQSTPIEE